MLQSLETHENSNYFLSLSLRYIQCANEWFNYRSFTFVHFLICGLLINLNIYWEKLFVLYFNYRDVIESFVFTYFELKLDCPTTENFKLYSCVYVVYLYTVPFKLVNLLILSVSLDFFFFFYFLRLLVRVS
jgi:hypothetical protein